MRRKHLLILLLFVVLGLPSYAQAPAVQAPPVATAPAAAPADNPLLKAWTTPFQVPPFAEIRAEHFLPAFEQAVAEQRKEVAAIAGNAQPATFANTIEAIENAGDVLSKINPVFSALQGSDTNKDIQAINAKVSPMLTALRDDVRLNPTLFARVKAVWDGRAIAKLTPEQLKLLDNTYKTFVRGGANLTPEQKDRLRKINLELATLGNQFGESLLHDTNAFRLVIEKREDLKGLPPSVVSMGADAAKAAGMAGKWVYTLQAPSIWPFLQGAENRELRRQIFTAYTTRCNHDDQYDTKKNVARQAALRAERAQLLGYKSHADFVLEDNMAKTPDKVYALLNQIWTPARAMALREAADMQAMIKGEGATFALEPWDWFYYAEKVKKAKYDLDEQAIRPYLKLENVREGAFYVANRLYGLTFTPRPDIKGYNAEVEAFEVKDARGTTMAIYFADYHPRPGKRVGAWSSGFRGTKIRDGKRVIPLVTNTCNFSRPTGGEPALLSQEEASTLFHEFGHALASILSQVPYSGIGGMPRDFVEVPSSIMENWAFEPEVFKVYAKHYKTGEVIPAALLDKMKKAEYFNQGFATVEYLAASFLDMDWHTLAATTDQDTAQFEQQSMAKIRLPAQIVPRYHSTYYNHVFGPGGGYSSGYYAYIWSEVHDADAFQAFKEKGNIFDPATATSFRKNILEKGGSEDVALLYKRFRGREPSVDPLLVRRGLKQAATD